MAARLVAGSGGGSRNRMAWIGPAPAGYGGVPPGPPPPASGDARAGLRSGGTRFGAILEDDRQRVVAGGILGRVADRGGGFGGLERNRRPIGIRRLVVSMHLGLGLTEKVPGHQLHLPARRGLAGRRTRPGRDGAVAARQAGEAETGGVLAPDRCVVPAVLAEAQQDGGIGDPRAVVGNGDGERRLVRRGGDFVQPGCGSGNRNAHPRGVGAAAVLEGFGEDVGEGCGIDAGDPFDGALVNAGADRAVHGRTSMRGVETETPRRRRDAGEALSRGRTATGRGGGTRGSPSGPGWGRGR